MFITKLELAASDVKSRYSLDGVRFTKEKVMATNGKMLAVLPKETATLHEDLQKLQDVTVSLPDIKTYRDLTKKYRRPPLVAHDKKTNTITFTTPDTTVSVRPLEGTFPDTGKIIPEKRDTDTVITLDVKLLYNLARALNVEDKDKPLQVTLRIRKPDDAVRVDTPIGTGVILPMVVYA